VTVPARFDHSLVANLKGAQFREPTEPWEHKREGIVVVSGAGVEPRATLQNAQLFDIAPTILSTFGLPVGKRIDGSPLPVV